MAPSIALSASESQATLAFLINALLDPLRHNTTVLGSGEILSMLDKKGVDKKDIADVLGIHPSQVTRLFYALENNPPDTPRKLQHDEAVKLVAAFRLEPGAPPLPPAVWRLIAHHIASRLALPLQEDDPRLRELVRDLSAFSRFVRNRQVQGLIEASENFFQAMQSQQELEPTELQETDPQPFR